VAFDDGISLSGNGGHVKPDAKILLIFQLITTDGGKTPYTRAACAPGRDGTSVFAGLPTPGIPPPGCCPMTDNRVALQPVSAYSNALRVNCRTRSSNFTRPSKQEGRRLKDQSALL
jgi:hypothetical protein